MICSNCFPNHRYIASFQNESMDEKVDEDSYEFCIFAHKINSLYFNEMINIFVSAIKKLFLFRKDSWIHRFSPFLFLDIVCSMDAHNVCTLMNCHAHYVSYVDAIFFLIQNMSCVYVSN